MVVVDLKRSQMKLIFRHYVRKDSNSEFGMVLFDLKRQPTLDVLIGKHVYVAALIKGKNR
jgi:hypothetical protein